MTEHQGPHRCARQEGLPSYMKCESLRLPDISGARTALERREIGAAQIFSGIGNEAVAAELSRQNH